jgi:molybdenum cofactor cytidylyltransferase
MSAAALLLAAGYSSRMGGFKPLLPLGGIPVVERAIRTFFLAGIDDVTVVTGHRREELARAIMHTGIRQVFSPQYDDGMFSSVRAGVRALPRNVDACFVLPVDIPLVRALTLSLLLRACENSPAAVFYPIFRRRRGHPPLIRRSVLDEVLSSDGAGGLRAVLARHAGEASEVEVIDEAIHRDVDTPADFLRAQELAANSDAPSAVECEEILARYHAAERLIRHSRVVAEVAEAIAASLPSTNLIDRSVLRAGSLLHDLAKGQPDHAHMAARVVEALRFPKVARVIACHHDLDFASRQLDEASIVYLADKLVQGENLVTLQQRFAPALARFAADLAAREAAMRRMETAIDVAGEVEVQAGRRLQEILAHGS